MEQFPLVSVIIPCYNLHDYILPCMESLDYQDYPNYEVLVVDDGSRDDSADIIRSFIANKPKFRMVQKPNGGLSSARNAGIREARGEWVSFVDGDDTVGPRYLSAMMDGLRQYPGELCTAGATAVNMQTGEESICRQGRDAHGNLPAELAHFSSCVFVWARMYSMKIIREHQVLFDERIRFGEDRPFNFSYLRHVNNYVFVDDHSYLYKVARKGSLTTAIVYPWQKSYVYGYVRGFLDACGDAENVKAALVSNQKLLGHMADMLLGDTINAALTANKTLYTELVQDDMAQFILHSYRPASGKSSLYWKLAVKRQYVLTVLLTKLYYCKPVFNFLKRSRLA